MKHQRPDLHSKYNFMHIFLGFFFGIVVASAWWFMKTGAAKEALEAVLAFAKEAIREKGGTGGEASLNSEM